MVINYCALLFPPYLLLLRPKRLGWRMFGTIQLKGEYGPPSFLGGSMIGRWFLWSVSFRDCKGGGYVDDQVTETKSKDEKFTVKSLYKALELKRQGASQQV